VPIPQAFLWRLTGRIPTPIGRLTDRRELDLAIRKGRDPAEVAAYPWRSTRRSALISRVVNRHARA
jgi:hypothetical protein